MARKDVNVGLKAQDHGVAKEFGKVGKVAKKAGSVLDKSFKGAARSMGKVRDVARRVDSSLETVGTQVHAVSAALSGLGQVVELAKLGATAERVEHRFEKFAEAAGGAESVLEGFQRGAGGAASQMAAMEGASKLLQMGLVQDADQMEKVVEMATRLGDQTQGVTERVQDFALMLSNTSIPRLDNFGISSGKVRTRIKELQAETKGLTREAAFMTAVMEAGGDSLGVLGPRVKDSAMEFEILEAKMADTRVEVGKKLAPAVAGVMGLFSDLLDIVAPLIDVVANFAAGIGDLASELTGIIGIDLSNIFSLDTAARTAKQLGQLAEGTEFAKEQTAEWVEEALEMKEAGGEVADIIGLYSQAVEDLDNKLAGLSPLQRALVNEGAILEGALEGQHEVILALSDSYPQYLQYLGGYNELTGNASVLTQMLLEDQWAAAKGIEAVAESAVEAVNPLHHLGSQWKEYSIAIRDADEKTRDLMSTQGENITVQQGLSGVLDAVAGSVQQIAAAEQANIDRREALASATEEQSARIAAALAAEQAAAAAAAGEQANLIQAMADVNEERFKQQVFEEISAEDVGLEAWAALGQEFGLVTEEQVAMAEGAAALIKAYEDGVVPAENMAEATEAVFAAAQDLNSEFEPLIYQFSNAPEAIAESSGAMELADMMIKKVSQDAPPAAKAMEDVGYAAEDIAPKLGDAMAEAEILARALEQLSGTYPVIVDIQTQGTMPTLPPGIPGAQHGAFTGPYSPLTQLHPNEAVLPLNNPAGIDALARAMQAALGKAGNTYNFNVGDPLAGSMALDRARRMDRANARM